MSHTTDCVLGHSDFEVERLQIQAAATAHSGIENQIPWNIIHDALPRWLTEDDPDFVAAKEAAERRER